MWKWLSFSFLLGLRLAVFAAVPDEARSFNFNVSTINMNPSQEEKIHEAISLIRKVIATEKFREKVLNFTFQGKKQFLDNKGLSNDEIYARLLAGAEELSPEKNNTMDLEVELYYEKTNTVGYTNPGTRRIWMNTKYFDAYSAVQVADNLVHEWMHKLGFDHDVYYSDARSSSVPYAVGYLVEELASELK